MRIERLDPDNPSDVAGVSSLHAHYLDDSPVLMMGEGFLDSFYYTWLVRDRLVDVVICKDEDQVVGFISFTDDPFHFISRGIRAHFLRLCWISLRELVASPKRLLDVIDVFRTSSDRSQDKAAERRDLGEVLSVVAHPDYQKKKPEGGNSRMTVRLFEEMAADFKARGFQSVRLNVKPENRASNIFCSTMGCRLEKVTMAGAPIHQFTYELPAAAGSE